MSRAETFRKAAKIIKRQKKLCQHYLHDPEGNYCMQGAVLKVLGIDTEQNWNEELENLPEVRLLALTLDEFYPRYDCVSNWNDKPGRTTQEAVKFLHEAAYMANYYAKIGVFDHLK